MDTSYNSKICLQTYQHTTATHWHKPPPTAQFEIVSKFRTDPIDIIRHPFSPEKLPHPPPPVLLSGRSGVRIPSGVPKSPNAHPGIRAFLRFRAAGHSNSCRSAEVAQTRLFLPYPARHICYPIGYVSSVSSFFDRFETCKSVAHMVNLYRKWMVCPLIIRQNVQISVLWKERRSASDPSRNHTFTIGGKL